MKKFLLFTFALALSATAFGQNSWRIELNSNGGASTGDFAGSDQINDVNGFSEYAYTGDLTTKYFIGKLGIGIRFYTAGFSRDHETYKTALTSSLTSTSTTSYLERRAGYLAYGSQIGVSYDFELAPNIGLEPSFYIGYMELLIPGDELVYSRNFTTRHYATDVASAQGVAFTPGIRLNWQVHKIVGISFNSQFMFTSMEEQTIEGVDYTALELDPVVALRSYQPQAFTVGIGVYFVIPTKKNQD
ncbi:hypothetical protein HZ996_05775 [Cryomorphaceae bacterium]|nr:hypothetical protein HZ996_05775 [Cryomorphaceae bacterium]